jgi:peptidoglycan hydrolase CwlO-like protein
MHIRKNILYKPKLLQKVIIFSLAFFLLVSSFSAPFVVTNVYAETSQQLTDKVNALNKQLDEIKKKRQAIESQLSQENNNQSSLQNQIGIYDNRIQSIELTIDEKQKSIESLSTQISLTQLKINDIQKKISDLQKQIDDLNIIHTTRVKNNFENSFRTPLDTVLNGQNFELLLIEKEFANSLAQDNQKIVNELTTSKTDLDTQKADLTAELTNIQTLQDQVKAENNDLSYQKQGLDYQKDQKTSFLSASEAKETQLKSQQLDAIKQQQQYQSQVDAFLLQLISTRSSGSPVKRGDPIGRMGRSGHVLTSGNRYPDPDKEPCVAAHTHFMVSVGNGTGKLVVTDPKPYLDSGKVGKPFPSYIVSQYYGNPQSFGGFHNGMDLIGSGGCGTTIYSAMDGVVSYGCSPWQMPGFRRDDAYYAEVYNAKLDMKTVYYHMQKPSGMAGCPV